MNTKSLFNENCRINDGFIPNAIIAGAPKCGTSSLHNWLVDHPDVMGAFEKETYFLSDPGTHMYKHDNNVRNGIEGYTKHFEADRGQTPQVILESTPSYIYSETALNAVPMLPTSAKVVFVLREPAAQIYSLFRFFQSNWDWIPENMEFKEFIELAKSGNTPDYKGNELAQNALQYARYVEFLVKWRNAVNPKNMKVILFEQMIIDPRESVQEVCDFLGLDPSFYDEYSFAASNETFSVRSRGLHKLNLTIRKHLPRGALYRTGRKLYRALNTQPARKKSIDDQKIIENLRGEYEIPNQLLASGFNLDLKPWQSK